MGGAGQQAGPHLQQPQLVVLSSVQLERKSSIKSAGHEEKSANNELLYSVDGSDKRLCSSEEPGLPPERVRAAGGDDGRVEELGEQLRLQDGQQHVAPQLAALTSLTAATPRQVPPPALPAVHLVPDRPRSWREFYH